MKLVGIIMVFAALSIKVSASEYAYRSIFYNEELLLSISEMEATFINEKESFSLTACDAKEIKCFDTFGMTFAIPESRLDIGMSWGYKDFTYIVDDFVSEKSSALDVGYFIIRSKIPSSENVGIFLFSEMKGLIGMRLLNGPHQGTVWLLNSRRGFPK